MIHGHHCEQFKVRTIFLLQNFTHQWYQCAAYQGFYSWTKGLDLMTAECEH